MSSIVNTSYVEDLYLRVSRWTFPMCTKFYTNFLGFVYNRLTRAEKEDLLEATLLALAEDLFGDGITFRVDQRGLPPNHPARTRISIEVPLEYKGSVVDGEEVLIAYMVEFFSDIEDDYVIVCRHR